MKTLMALVQTCVRRIGLAAVVATLLALAPGVARAGTIVVGIGSSGAPLVEVYDDGADSLQTSFLAYDPGFTGGVRVAASDLNGDGVPDIITGAGPGGAPIVEVFDGTTGTLIRSFFAFDPLFTGGVFVAAGDVNGDGAADLIVAADAGGAPAVKVFDGASGTLLRSFLAYGAGFAGGVRVAAGDVNGDGVADIVTGPGPGGLSNVEVFDGATGVLIRSFIAFDPLFAGGVFVAAGDTTGDRRADIIVGADAGGAPLVKVFDAVTGSELQSFFAFAPTFTGGVRVTAADLTGDGVADLIVGAGPGGGPVVAVFDGQTGASVRTFFAAAPNFAGGIYVAAGLTSKEALTNLIAAVSGRLDESTNLLANALRSLNAGKTGPACNMLGAFVHQVNAQSGKALDVDEAGQFVVAATHLQSSIGCR